MSAQSREEKLKEYPSSEHDNFHVVDTIGVPHPFCITPRHVSYASDHCSGMLVAEAIEAAEREAGKPTCGMKGCNLDYGEHETALLVACKLDLKSQQGKDTELHKYLLSIKGLCEKHGFAGFSFVKHEVWTRSP